MKLFTVAYSKPLTTATGEATVLYSEKQLKDIKNSFDYITVEKILSRQGIFVSDRTTNMHSAECKIKFTGHWLRCSTTPNVPTLFIQSSQAKKLVFIFFAATFTWSLLMF